MPTILLFTHEMIYISNMFIGLPPRSTVTQVIDLNIPSTDVPADDPIQGL
jgi:hypothetical protein